MFDHETPEIAAAFDSAWYGSPRPVPFGLVNWAGCSADNGYYCSRERGHDGQHVALGTSVVRSVWFS